MSKKPKAPATPALAILDAAGVSYRTHSYEHDAAASIGFGLETAAVLGVDPARVFKTLMTRVDGQLVTAVVPASGLLNLKSLAAAVGGKKAEMAAPAQAERATGYVVGGISPLGQKRRHRLVIDTSARHHQTILVSGGRRGLSLELNADDLAAAAMTEVDTSSATAANVDQGTPGVVFAPVSRA
ncbi:MAG: Cys-tRNA(Pro) deacylase [Propionibacteriaceae bacterium]|jgi:Cys-tRNA(Pro)/Cys-tRNA(Cys) deacylase|nr:Cys-tRNA(Pro) deacylase [Propionibacteriaceae bacterium]